MSWVTGRVSGISGGALRCIEETELMDEDMINDIGAEWLGWVHNSETTAVNCFLCPLMSISSSVYSIMICPLLYILSTLKTLNSCSSFFVSILCSSTAFFVMQVCVHPESTNAISLHCQSLGIQIFGLTKSSHTLLLLWGIVYNCWEEALVTMAQEFVLTLNLQKNPADLFPLFLLIPLPYSWFMLSWVTYNFSKYGLLCYNWSISSLLSSCSLRQSALQYCTWNIGVVLSCWVWLVFLSPLVVPFPHMLYLCQCISFGFQLLYIPSQCWG